MAMQWLEKGGTAVGVRRDLSNADRALIQVELGQLRSKSPWTEWGYGDIRLLYIRLGNLAGQVDVSQMMVDVSHEAWRWWNVASPDFHTRDGARRRQVAPTYEDSHHRPLFDWTK